MRNTLTLGLALLATTLVNAEDTRVSSYNDTIDDQVKWSAETNPSARAENMRNDRRKDATVNTVEEQRKWEKLSPEERRKLAEKRTEKRTEALKHIEKRYQELDRESEKLMEKRESMNREEYDQKQWAINQKRAKLGDLRARIEHTPEGQNVDLDAPFPVESRRK